MATTILSRQGVITAGRQLVDSTTMMARFSYRSRDAWWEFVRAQGIPHIRLNARRIMFDPAQVDAWLEKRTVGGAA